MLKRWMLIVLLIGGLGGAFWYALPEAHLPVRTGDVAINYSLPDLQGVAHSLPKDGVVLLNFWATWCPPCRQELPSMAALHRKMESRGLKVIAVSIDRSKQELEGFVRENHLPFQVLHDQDAAVSKRYGVFKYPESFLIDRHGTVRYHMVGAVDWMSEPVLQVVDGLLGESADGEQAGQ